jgi:large subunit ribosomal protein L29
MVRVDEFRALGTEDLKKQLEDSKQELLNLRFRVATKQLVNHRELPMVKKRIARIRTILKERELEIR